MYTKFISVKKIVHKKKFKKNSAQKNHEKNYCTEFIRKKNCAQKKNLRKKRAQKKIREKNWSTKFISEKN